MGKTMSARDMLQAGRRPSSERRQVVDPDRPAPLSEDAAAREDADAVTSPLVDSGPKRLVDESTSRLGDLSTNQTETSRGVGDTGTSRLVPQAAATRGLVTQSYQRATFFLTPRQRRWLKDTAHDLPAGLSASDIVRLAVSRLESAIEAGEVALVDALVAQAHAEAATHPGRRNRGLPTLEASN